MANTIHRFPLFIEAKEDKGISLQACCIPHAGMSNIVRIQAWVIRKSNIFNHKDHGFSCRHMRSTPLSSEWVE